MSQSDVPTGLVFVDPDESESTYRVCLWAAPGAGKSVAAASAPGPILVLTADRPSAYRFARKHWRDNEARTRTEHAANPEVEIRPAAEIREVRYTGADTLAAVYRYLGSDEGADVRTLVIDPVSNVIDALRDVAPVRGDGDIDHAWVNKKVLGFVQSLRSFDINVILVAHERLNDGKNGDGKLYPALGGAALVNKLLAELDICAHIERVERERKGGDPEAVWIGQMQPRGLLVCKEATGVLGDRRVADLTRWFQVATTALEPEQAELPWDDAQDQDFGADVPEGSGAGPGASEEDGQQAVAASDPASDATAADEPEELPLGTERQARKAAA